MKALMKGNAKAYFAKKEKVKEDPEQVINRLEAVAIAKVIGIADHQVKADYASFFELIQKIKLPKGFKRYLNPQKNKVLYLDEVSEEEFETHPNIDIFKVAFYEIIKNNKTVYTFEAKTRKLLPFVEEKLMRQCIGLASKRRDAQKANLQKDQSGRMVISKLARLKPDVRGLLSSRSYMLKNLVQKIYTKKQLWGRGKRANLYAHILAQYNKDKNNLDIPEDEQVETEYSLQTYEKIFTQTRDFYYRRFGYLDYIPKQLMSTKQFIKSTPDSVFRNLNFLNIDKESLQLYWLARLMECLPLPENWARKSGKSFDQFLYEPQKIVFELHPSYLYIIESMNRFKGIFDKMDLAQQNYYTMMRQMIFFDYFERPYFVDWFAYMSQAKQGRMTRKKMTKKTEELKNNDWMAIEAVVNSGMKERDYPFMQRLMEYWGSLNYQQETYLPAISPFGEIIWSSRLNQKTIHFCPHTEKLENLYKQEVKNIMQINKEKDLKGYDFDSQELKALEDSLLYRQLPKAREQFLKFYLMNNNFRSEIQGLPDRKLTPYSLPQTIDKDTFYDIIFTSQFNLLAGIPLGLNQNDEEVMPLWLQKCLAKLKSTKLYTILSNFNKDIKLEEIKRIILRQAIEQAKIHEPGSEEELYRMLEQQVVSIKQLKKFVRYVNDIDAREERKKKAKMGMAKQEENNQLEESISHLDEEQLAEYEQSEEEQEQESEMSSDADQPDISESSSQEQQPEVEEEQKVESESQVSSESTEKLPEYYDGITYQQIPELDEVKEQQIDTLLTQMKKIKTLKHKYSSQSIRDRISSIQLKDPQNSIDIKKNLLISQLRSYHAPYKVSPSKLNIKKKGDDSREFYTPQGAPDITEELLVFQSEASEYSTFGEEMHEIIQQIKRNRPPTPPSQTQESQITDYAQKRRFSDDTQETIHLQPILRIKPDIGKDPHLEHVSSFFKADQFQRCFGQAVSPQKISRNKSQKQMTPPKFIRNASYIEKLYKTNELLLQTKLKMPNNSAKAFEEYHSLNPQSTLGNKSKMERMNSQALIKMGQSNENMSNFGKNLNSKGSFNRVCLGSTASSLLQTDPITRRGDLIVLQAQKELLQKGRGLATKIGKQY